jgi:hypothetical protein
MGAAGLAGSAEGGGSTDATPRDRHASRIYAALVVHERRAPCGPCGIVVAAADGDYGRWAKIWKRLLDRLSRDIVTSCQARRSESPAELSIDDGSIRAALGLPAG